MHNGKLWLSKNRITSLKLPLPIRYLLLTNRLITTRHPKSMVVCEKQLTIFLPPKAAINYILTLLQSLFKLFSIYWITFGCSPSLNYFQWRFSQDCTNFYTVVYPVNSEICHLKERNTQYTRCIAIQHIKHQCYLHWPQVNKTMNFTNCRDLQSICQPYSKSLIIINFKFIFLILI